MIKGQTLAKVAGQDNAAIAKIVAAATAEAPYAAADDRAQRVGAVLHFGLDFLLGKAVDEILRARNSNGPACIAHLDDAMFHLQQALARAQIQESGQ